MAETKIEWTEKTWNPLRGCSRISEGCRNCYAERMAARFSKPGEPFFSVIQDGHWNRLVELVESKLDEPLRWRKPCRVFVNSMSDLFHDDVPDEDINRIFAVMASCPQHTFQILTKRAAGMRQWAEDLRGHLSIELKSGQTVSRILPIFNVWLGVSVEDRTSLARLDHLRATPAAVRFVSFEPLLEDLGTLDLSGIGWAIVGGESGPGARPCSLEWIRSIVQQCAEANVPCFVKQLGTAWVREGWEMCHANGETWANKKGGDPAQWPTDLRVRQYPEVPRG